MVPRFCFHPVDGGPSLGCEVHPGRLVMGWSGEKKRGRTGGEEERKRGCGCFLISASIHVRKGAGGPPVAFAEPRTRERT